MPVISIILSAYNASAYLDEAIQSILQQSFTDFELLLLDDGSMDETLSIALSYHDPRIQVVSRPNGYVSTLNYGLSIAQGKYIARLDADDRMHPDRLRIQHAIMERDSTLSICASAILRFGEEIKDELCSEVLHSGYVDFLPLALLRGNFIYHPTVMLRRSFLQKHNLQYKEESPYAEDYHLWVDMALAGAKLYIDPRPLTHYRVHSEQISRLRAQEQAISSQRVQLELLDYLIRAKEDKEWCQIADSLQSLQLKGLVKSDQVIAIMHALLWNNRYKKK